MDDFIYIKYLEKPLLLYNLWKNAKISHYFYECPDIKFDINIEIVKKDINFMLEASNKINVSVYHGKNLYVDITDDYLKCDMYNILNGKFKAENIILELKTDEMKKSILRYYTLL